MIAPARRAASRAACNSASTRKSPSSGAPLLEHPVNEGRDPHENEQADPRQDDDAVPPAQQGGEDREEGEDGDKAAAHEQPDPDPRGQRHPEQREGPAVVVRLDSSPPRPRPGGRLPPPPPGRPHLRQVPV